MKVSNDLLIEEIADAIVADIKGGPGSGIRGHRTVGNKPPAQSHGSKTPVTQGDKDLSDMIDLFTGMTKDRTMPEGYKFKTNYDLVKEYGRYFEIGPLPKEVKTGTVKQCYANAARLALQNPKKYTYVEGMALPDIVAIPLQHAWCIDKSTGKVVDPTWSKKNGSTTGLSYLGIPFTINYLRNTLIKTKMYGVIPDYPRGDKHNPLKDGFPEAVIVKQALDLSTIKDKKKDHENYHYIEDYMNRPLKEFIGLFAVMKDAGDLLRLRALNSTKKDETEIIIKQSEMFGCI